VFWLGGWLWKVGGGGGVAGVAVAGGRVGVVVMDIWYLTDMLILNQLKLKTEIACLTINRLKVSAQDPAVGE